MRISNLMASTSLAVLVTLAFAAPSLAQTAPQPNDQASEVDEVVVTGVRASVQSAIAIKRNADTIVDSIVAEDIGKLPDVNVSEALQRITGIQIDRDYGEGSSVRIRGLSQIETLLNGREVFTAGGGRNFNFQDLAAELIAGIDVYKAPTSNLIEGGIGGTIDVRTHMPFDFRGATISGSARARYNDLTGKTSPLYSGLVSNRWNTGAGEVGALVSFAYQERDFRNDTLSAGGPSGRTDVIPGQTVITPNGTYVPGIVGNRTRTGVDAAFQWKPSDSLEFYAQGNYSKFENITEQYGLNLPTNGLAVQPGSVTLFPGTNIFQKGTFLNVPITTFGVSRDTFDENKAFGGGVKWNHNNWRVNLDLSYASSTNDLYYRELDLIATAPTLTQDHSNGIAQVTTSGVDLANLANYRIGNLTLSENHYEGTLKAAVLDVIYDVPDDGPLKQLRWGVRASDRDATFTPVRFGPSAPPGAVRPATAFADLFIKGPYADFFTEADRDVNFIRDFQIASPDPLRDFETVRTRLGYTAVPTTNPLSIFSINEKTYTGYFTAKFAGDFVFPWDGNVGLRFIKSEGTLVGTVATFTGGVQTGYRTLNQNNSYTDGLPSANIRIHLNDDLQLRLAASRTITRPNFDQLSPSITLIPGQLRASAGNPDLQPLRSDSLDASLEYYFGQSNTAYVAVFQRKVEGFISSITTPNTIIDGLAYDYSFPSNAGGDGTVQGIELGYTQFFDFLPGLFSGLGLQANYSYIESEAFNATAGRKIDLTGLSPHSYNVVAFYEKGPLQARIAYNFRSDTPTGYSNLTNIGFTTSYRKGYGWVDASATYDVNDHISITAEASNLSRSQTETYVGSPEVLGTAAIDDVQFNLGVRVKY